MDEQVDTFWSADFDMDLLKVLPRAKAIIAPIAAKPLWTYGLTTNGRLNSPSMWNWDHGMISFWGTFPGNFKPQHYWSGSREFVQTTVEDAIRDMWVHNCIMICDGVKTWNSEPLRPYFESLMYQLRGWGEGRFTHSACEAFCLASIENAVSNITKRLTESPRSHPMTQHETQEGR